MNLALIVEDDIDLSNIFTRALTAAGFRVETIADGLEAEARIAETAAAPPSVVVLDLHLPGVSGRTLLRQIRSKPDMAGTFVIVTTADARLGDALQNEADLVLIKPVSYTQLRDLAARFKTASQ